MRHDIGWDELVCDPCRDDDHPACDRFRPLLCACACGLGYDGNPLTYKPREDDDETDEPG